MTIRIGVDLGGTKTEIIALHPLNGKELYRQRVPTPRDNYQATIENIRDMVLLTEKTLNDTGTVGVGIPGTISKVTNTVKNANSTWLNGQSLGIDLKQLLARDVRVENDANCMAVSEAVDGAGAGHTVVFGVIIGTGCGAGVVINGKPMAGLNGLGGEWGHNPLPLPRLFTNSPHEYETIFDGDNNPIDKIHPIYKHKPSPEMFVATKELSEYPGHQCYCGKRGCVETWISGPAFKNDYARVTELDASTHDIIALVASGDVTAKDALERYTDRLARALSTIVNTIDPDIIVLGGGMSNVQYLYERLPQIWERYIFSDSCGTPIVPARHGDSSGVRGAAWLWND
jgi:fructokinase